MTAAPRDGEMNPSREKMRVVLTGICDGLGELRQALEAHAEFDLRGWSDNVADASGLLAGASPSVVLHATRGTAVPTAELTAIREQTKAPIILLGSSESSALLEYALEADVADVLLLPQLAQNVIFAMRKAQRGQRTVVQEAPSGGPRGRVVTVFAPKGGTGKSVIATNSAVSLAKNRGKRTLLIDLDLQFGDAAIMLGTEPEKTIYDLVAAPGQLDSDKLAGYTLRHPTGLDVLAAPLRPEDAELVTEAKVTSLLEVAKEAYDAIVVDTSPFFHGPMLAVLDQTDGLLLLTGTDVPTLKNVSLSMQTLSLLSFPEERLGLVLNHTTPKRGMKRAEIERALETKVRFEVPYDSDVPAAVNRGNPPVLESGKFARAIEQMTGVLITSDGTKRGKRSLVGGFRRRGDSADSEATLVAGRV